MKIFFLSLLGLALSSPSWAVYQELGNIYDDPRALGMGRATTAVADDYSALYDNPAGLSLIEEWNINTFLSGDATLQLLTSLLNMKNAFAHTDDGSGSSGFQQALDLLTPYKNKNVHSGIGLGSFWSWKDGPLVFDDMSMGLNIQFKNDPYFSENLTDFVLRSMGDAHFIMGKAIPFFNDESLRIGASGRIGYRVNTESNYNLIDIFANHVNPPLFTAESTRERVYVDVDAGVQWDLPFYQRYRPRIGISALNLLNQKQILNPHLLYATSGDNVEEFQRRLNVGLSTRLPAFYIFEPTIAFDVKDIGIYTASIWNRLHLGVDIKFLLYEWWEGSIRLGIDQGYFTAGGYGLIGVGFKGTLDIVYYGREVGWVAGQNGDQRLLVQIGFKI